MTATEGIHGTSTTILVYMSESERTRRDVLAAGGAAVLAGLAGCNTTSGETAPGGTTPAETSTPSSETDPEPEADSEYARAYRQTIESVVLVETDQGQGTGFMFDDSHVVTNAHVVGAASESEVRFNTGEWSTGEVVGTDPDSDLAAIAVDDVPPSATPLQFAEAGATIGQKVVAIGNPYDLNGSLTTGVVSGTDRSIPAPTGFSIPDAIQTDAPVNPGNSGGPLVSLDGRVVAVINSGGGDNIAFGISAALTQRVVPALIDAGTYEHSYLGVSFGEVSPEVARVNNLEDPRGLMIVDVRDGAPADGVLRPSEEFRSVGRERLPVGGDVVIAIDGTELATAEDLGGYLSLQTQPGDTVDLTVLRDGSERTVELELGTRPAEV